MRTLAVAALTVALIMPAHAQTMRDDDQKSSKAELEQHLTKKKKETEEIEKAYNETVKKTRDQPVAKKTDPWANMR
jgi:cell division protein FtsL